MYIVKITFSMPYIDNNVKNVNINPHELPLFANLRKCIHAEISRFTVCSFQMNVKPGVDCCSPNIYKEARKTTLPYYHTSPIMCVLSPYGNPMLGLV